MRTKNKKQIPIINPAVNTSISRNGETRGDSYTITISKLLFMGLHDPVKMYKSSNTLDEANIFYVT